MADDTLDDQQDSAQAPSVPPPPESDRPGQPLSVCARRLTGAILALGIVLRVVEWARGRSLWGDEAMLALNLMHRDFTGLLRPLDHDQGAPLGFLLAMKSIILLFGSGEYALRLLPLLAGIGALFIFLKLCREALKPREVIPALALFAALGPLVYYSAEAKQYSSDVLCTLLMLWLTLKTERQGLSGPRAWMLGVAGALGLWFSHPLIFTLAGLGLTQGLSAATHRQWRAGLLWLVIGAGWLASFALIYKLSLNQLGANAYLHSFWLRQHAFMPLDRQWAAWTWSQLNGHISGMPLMIGFFPWALALFALGHIQLFRHSRRRYFLLLAPLLLTLAASALQKYPFKERLILFLNPIQVLWLAYGLQWLRERHWRPLTLTACLLSSVLLVNTLQVALNSTLLRRKPDVGPMIKKMARKMEPGDAVYVHFPPQILTYYAERYRLDDPSRYPNFPKRSALIGRIKEKPRFIRFFMAYAHAQTQPSTRLWVLNGNHYKSFGQDSKWLHAFFKQFGPELKSYRDGVARLDLFELKQAKIRTRLAQAKPPAAPAPLGKIAATPPKPLPNG